MVFDSERKMFPSKNHNIVAHASENMLAQGFTASTAPGIVCTIGYYPTLGELKTAVTTKPCCNNICPIQLYR